MSGFTAILLKYLIGLVGITIVVVIHEIGHLLTAKMNGIEVEVFSIGIGPKICSTMHKGTEYRLSLFPLGGYCRLKGSDDLSQALIHNKHEFTHTEEGSLFSAHPARRILTYLSGPMANILFAILLYALLATIPSQTLSMDSVVATTEEYPTLFDYQRSPAYQAGIRKGDRIVAVNGSSIEDWQEVETMLLESGEEASFTILRDGQIEEYLVQGAATREGGFRFGLTPIQDLIIGSIRYGSPEYEADLSKGDIIVGVQGIPVENQLDLLVALQSGKNEMIRLSVQNGSTLEQREVLYTPSHDEEGNVVLGFSLETKTKRGERMPFSMKEGLRKGWQIARDTVNSLLTLVRGAHADIRSEVTGMARSALLIGDITAMGFENNIVSGMRGLLYLMGVVSISLAIVNLLPIPAFDGGQILIALIEWITAKQMQPKMYYHLQLLGIIFVMVLFLILTLGDIRHFLAIKR
ncbi:MAG: RIP metalloprotease RseP [Sphaerochaeta sp.]